MAAMKDKYARDETEMTMEAEIEAGLNIQKHNNSVSIVLMARCKSFRAQIWKDSLFTYTAHLTKGNQSGIIIMNCEASQ
jgi:hypothetical protein